MTEEEREELRTELADVLAHAKELGEIIQALDKELAPYWARRRSLHNEGAHTHHWVDGIEAQRADWRLRGDKDVVVAWRPADRCGLFAESDRLAKAYGPTVTRRKNTQRELNTLWSWAKRIQTLLKRKSRAVRAEQQLSSGLKVE